MLHEANPALVTLKQLRDNNKIPQKLTVKHLGPNSYSVVDNEGVAHGNYDSYYIANAAINTAKDK